MARTVDQIKQQIYDAIGASPVLAIIFPNPSKVAIWKELAHAIAVCIAIFEQILDVFKTDIEAMIDAAPPGSNLWVKKKVFDFQYQGGVPQVLILNSDLVPVYQVVDESLRIISRCSVMTDDTVNKQALVKAATGEPPAALDSFQLAALNAYLKDGGVPAINATGIGFAGVNYLAISAAPDRIYINAEVFYNGQFSDSIKSAVIAAMNQWIADVSSSLNFDGVFRIDDLRAYVRAVPGVIDVSIEDFAHRKWNVGFGSKTYIIQTFVATGIDFIAAAGYAIGEDDSGHTFTDSVTFTAA